MVESQVSPRGSLTRSGFLRPAVALLNRLRYAQKFALIAALVVAPLAVVTYLQIQGTNDQAVFNRKEHYGVNYVDPLREVFRTTQRFGDLQAQALAGDASVAEDFRLATTRVDEAMAAVDGPDKEYGADFGTTATWNGAKQEWATLKQTQLSPEAAAASREKLRGLLRTLVFEVGNGSNLTLDPDVDSYWLQDSVVGTLVNLTDLVHRTGSQGAKAAGKGSLTAEDRVEMAGLHRSSVDQLRQIVDSNLKTSITQNPSGTVRPALQEQIQRTDQVVGDYLKWLRESYVSGTGAPSAAEIRTRSLAATEQLHLLQQKIMPVLDDLINARVTRYVRNRNLGLVLALLAFALLAYAFTGFFSSVRASVDSLGQATQRMIAGSEEAFHVASRDELGQIGESYNSINKALIEARRLRSRVEGENQELQANILNLLGVVSDAADGNLTVRATVSAGAMGNVADAFNQMVESWQGVVGEIQKLFERTNAAVAGIQSSAQEMAHGAGQQVDEILGATASVSRVTEGIQKVSATAESASGAGRKTLESAQLGTASVQAVVRGMEGLRANVQAGAKKIKTLGDRSMEITSIVGTIAKISDQTNMLALNAAIEAARAGEHGRGFSVVADQVRQLAERTASATHEIESLVRAIQAETNESVDAIEQQTAVVEAESKVVSSAGEALARISEVSNQSASLIQEIDTVARQQVEGVVGVARIMEQVSFIARKTQSSADESVKSAAALAVLSGQLRERVNQFRI